MAKTSPHQCPVVLPLALNTPEFESAWAEYVAYRRERRLPKLLPRSVQKQWDKLSDAGPEAAIAAINDTIAQGWTGIFIRAEQGLPAARNTARASLGALQMQLKAVENDLESIFYPGGCTYRVNPSPENRARAQRLLDQRLKLKNQIEVISCQ